ncbi:hypothetical protein MMC16_007697 [Acarospora aff. strigata]|nr:hypothetical protein [Acarospora aff. strigata]
METTPTPPPSPPSTHPKRVILRLRVSDFSGRDPTEWYDAIRSYLTFAGRPFSEFETNKHCTHIEPFQQPDVPQTSFHIILDMDSALWLKRGWDDLKGVEHEVYHVRRDGERNFQVKPIQDPRVEKNLIEKIRRYTDDFYAWGK